MLLYLIISHQETLYFFPLNLPNSGHIDFSSSSPFPSLRILLPLVLMKIKSSQSWFFSVLPFIHDPESVQQRLGRCSKQWQTLRHVVLDSNCGQILGPCGQIINQWCKLLPQALDLIPLTTEWLCLLQNLHSVFPTPSGRNWYNFYIRK